jgi:hypothetical protein
MNVYETTYILCFAPLQSEHNAQDQRSARHGHEISYGFLSPSSSFIPRPIYLVSWTTNISLWFKWTTAVWTDWWLQCHDISDLADWVRSAPYVVKLHQEERTWAASFDMIFGIQQYYYNTNLSKTWVIPFGRRAVSWSTHAAKDTCMYGWPLVSHITMVSGQQALSIYFWRLLLSLISIWSTSMYPTHSLYLDISHTCAYHILLVFMVLSLFSEYMHAQDDLRMLTEVWKGGDLAVDHLEWACHHDWMLRKAHWVPFSYTHSNVRKTNDVCLFWCTF